MTVQIRPEIRVTHNREQLYRYDLDATTMDTLEALVIECAQREAPESPIVAVRVPYDAPAANFGRTGEQIVFDKLGEKYDFNKGMSPYETSSTFLYTVDKHDGVIPRIAHSKRIVSARLGIKDEDGRGDGLTGLEPIDDRLLATDPKERMCFEDLLIESGLSVEGLARVINVATNFTTERAEPATLWPHSLFSYKATFALAMERGAPAIVAYMNLRAKLSLGKMGVDNVLLGGKSFHLPKTDGGYDENYVAVVIPGSEHNISAFTNPDAKSPLLRRVADIDVPLISCSGGVA